MFPKKSEKDEQEFEQTLKFWFAINSRRQSLPRKSVHKNSTTRYDPREKKYRNRRCIPWRCVPEVDTEVPGGEEHKKAYTWWPVAILRLKDEAALRLQLANWMYIICVYQAMLDQPVAWGMPVTQLLHLPHFQDKLTFPIQIYNGAVSAPHS